MGTAAIVGGAGAVLGGIAGGQADVTSTSSFLQVMPPTALEQQATGISESQLGDLEGLVSAGPGQEDVRAGLEARRSLASRLQGLTETGGLPGQADISAARGFTTDIFAPERVAQQQAFAGQEQRTAQLAARLGRSVSDPILQARLAQEQTQQQERLGARETAFSAQQARQLPLQRLQFQGALADVRSGLATQAFQNRQNLFALGQQALTSERNFRLATGTQFGTQTSGGGLGGAIGGALAGAGTGLSAAGALSGIGGGGGGLASGGTAGGGFGFRGGFLPQSNINQGLSTGIVAK